MLSHTSTVELQSLIAAERIQSLGVRRDETSAANAFDHVEPNNGFDAHGGARACPPVPGARPAATS